MLTRFLHERLLISYELNESNGLDESNGLNESNGLDESDGIHVHAADEIVLRILSSLIINLTTTAITNV